MPISKQLLNKIKNSPIKPGCYIYKDLKGKILYIGKAVNLRNRTSSYFNNLKRLDPKIAVMVKQIRDVEYITTDNELEALILETNLIKKYKPKYNRLMKDDKNYSWLMITKGEDFPKIELVREQKIKNADYFGPYVNPSPIKRALKRLRSIFPYRSCNRKIYFYKENDKNKFYSSDKKPCLYYHLRLCDAPCTGDIVKASYRKNINNIKRFFRSQKFKIIDELNREMQSSAQKKKYEEASLLRDKLEDLSYIAQRIRIEKDMDEFIWKKKKKSYEITALKNLLNKLKIKNLNFKKDLKIECYDISNISGKSATGSMIVFINGKPDKSLYRKFKIKTKDEPDDFSMLKEVFKRRFKINKSKKDRSFNNYPDIIIVDGGKGQLSSVKSIIESKKLAIATIGLAKKEEEIFKSENGNFKRITLKKGSPEYFLIQRIRDEAHRFAIKYHKILRSKKQVKSVLDDIPGVGDTIKKRLLKAFGSARNIKNASLDEIQSIVKNRKTAQNIKKLL